MILQASGFRLSKATWLAAVSLLLACVQATIRPTLEAPEYVPPPDAKLVALKVHMKSGELSMLFRGWQVVDSGHALRGVGRRYSVTRLALDSGEIAVPVDSIALIEVDARQATHPFGADLLTLWTILYGVVDVACLADPKSCFGSCPTFYLDGTEDSVPRAEGFSASIARVLEATDVDALRQVRQGGSRVSVTMRNEALETHAVRWVRLLGVPRPPGGRVFATPDGRFYPALGVTSPGACRGPEGDCFDAVTALDGRERISLADSNDLATRETLEVVFPRAAGSLGVVVGARNTLLGTYLFYQTLAYMGGSAGEWLALLERSGRRTAGRVLGIGRLLGGIDVDVAGGDGRWRPIGSYRETGPIAGDVQVFPFQGEHFAQPVRVRLRMTKGDWRLDYVALAQLGAPVAALGLEPVMVESHGRPDSAALASLRDPRRYLVTGPGDAYRIVFDLPATEHEYELFLETRGYYYEWIRSDWLREEDSAMVRLVLSRPAEALRRLARPYKAREALMERLFWRSRFGR